MGPIVLTARQLFERLCARRRRHDLIALVLEQTGKHVADALIVVADKYAPDCFVVPAVGNGALTRSVCHATVSSPRRLEAATGRANKCGRSDGLRCRHGGRTTLPVYASAWQTCKIRGNSIPRQSPGRQQGCVASERQLASASAPLRAVVC